MSTNFFNSFLVEKGNETNTNANGNYSSSPQDFIFHNTTKGFLLINKLVVFMKDSTGKLKDDIYGNDVILTNGITLFKQGKFNDTQFTPDPIKCNMEWGKYSSNITKYKCNGIGELYGGVSITWNFGSNINIRLEDNETLVVRLNDNFTGLTEHCFMVC